MGTKYIGTLPLSRGAVLPNVPKWFAHFFHHLYAIENSSALRVCIADGLHPSSKSFPFPLSRFLLILFLVVCWLVMCHTRLSEENQVQAYMHARIKFHAYSDIKVNTETVSHMKKKDYQRFTLYPGNEGTKHHRQSTGGCVRLAPATSSYQLPFSEQQWL
jgi:hypothetical protein